MSSFLPFVAGGGSVYIMAVGAYGAYFDESERLEAGDPLCVAGFTFKDSKYREFCRDWERLLQTAIPHRRLTSIHMKELIHAKKQFEGIGIPQRVDCLKRATEIICAHALVASGVMVDQKEFESLAGPEWPLRFGSSYTMLCQRAAQNTADFLRKNKRKSPIVFTFEAGHKWENETDKVFKGIQRTPHLRKMFQYGQHMFEEKARCYGAQAADIAAWVSVRIRVGGVNESFQPFAPPLARLIRHFESKEAAQVRFLSGSSLLDFIGEQIARPVTEEVRYDVGPAKRKFR